ncbi:MAG: hypothetical protein HDT43_00660 [Ruminococcaceae bacterium]|nr:hypothetical protein [Oscillospiraceae bacterium]
MNYYPQQGGINWVQGIAGANAYPLMPNTNAVLMDRENEGIFYIKICDNVGMYTLRTFRYTEIVPQEKPAANIDMSNFVSREEFNALKALIEERSANNEQPVSANCEQPTAAAAGSTGNTARN